MPCARGGLVTSSKAAATTKVERAMKSKQGKGVGHLSLPRATVIMGNITRFTCICVAKQLGWRSI